MKFDIAYKEPAERPIKRAYFNAKYGQICFVSTSVIDKEIGLCIEKNG